VRAKEEGLILQQLLYADEVRSLEDLDIEQLEPSASELKLALQLIDQISQESYEPAMFEDEEKKRILAAIDAKIAGEEIVAAEHPEDVASGQVIDLAEMLKASLARNSTSGPQVRTAPKRSASPPAVAPLRSVSSKAKRAPKVPEKAEAPAPSRARMKK